MVFLTAMDQAGAKRKLAAVLSADVVGYSRLMQEGDKATLLLESAEPRSSGPPAFRIEWPGVS